MLQSERGYISDAYLCKIPKLFYFWLFALVENEFRSSEFLFLKMTNLLYQI